MGNSCLPTVILREILMAVETGSRPAGGSDTSIQGIPSIGGENIRLDGSLDLQKVRHIPKQFYLNMSSGHLRAGDVLINKDGAQTGKVAIYQGEFRQAAINEHCFLLRGSPEIDQLYLYYYLVSEYTQRKIYSQITGSAQPGLNQSFLNYISISLPPLEEQRQIVNILKSADEAIHSKKVEVGKLSKLRSSLAADLLSGRIRTISERERERENGK